MSARRPAAVAVAAALAAVPGTALAHSTVIGTQPAEGARLTAAPRTMTITFNEEIRPEFTYAKLTGPSGSSEVSAAASGRDLVVTAGAPLANGSYTLAYRIASKDTHPVSGVLHFTVAVAASTSPTTVPTSTPAATSTTPSTAPAAPATSTAAEPTGSDGPSTGWLLGLTALGVIAAVAGWFAGRWYRRR